MLNDRIETFIDRHEAIALFNHLRGRDPSKPWPLLPILTFIAPGGSGKSTLIDYLCVKHCCMPNGSAAIPYAYLDFTLADTPKKILPILVAIRNQLKQHDDGQGRHLTFPRFDLGASIALAAPVDGNMPLLNEDEIQRRLSAGLPFFGPLGEMGNALGNAIPIIPPLIVGLKWFTHIPQLQTILQCLEKGSGWKWYLTQSANIGFQTDDNIREVILHLHTLSILCKPGRRGKEYLVEHVLPAALLADLLDALDSSMVPQAWSKTANIVLFLDGFDALLDDSSNDHEGIPQKIGIRLLEMLTLTDHRRRGETDPLLLVIGSSRRLLNLADADQHPPFEQLTIMKDEPSAREHARELYERWHKQLPRKKSALWLKDLYLPMWLNDFGLADTHRYLSELGRREQQILIDAALAEAIHQITKGHPFYLALIGIAILEAQARGQSLKPDEFEQARCHQC